jgi:hypothetical protein
MRLPPSSSSLSRDAGDHPSRPACRALRLADKPAGHAQARASPPWLQQQAAPAPAPARRATEAPPPPLDGKARGYGGECRRHRPALSDQVRSIASLKRNPKSVMRNPRPPEQAYVAGSVPLHAFPLSDGPAAAPMRLFVRQPQPHNPRAFMAACRAVSPAVTAGGVPAGAQQQRPISVGSCL